MTMTEQNQTELSAIQRRAEAAENDWRAAEQRLSAKVKQLAAIRALFVDDDGDGMSLDLGFTALTCVLADYGALLGDATERGEHHDPESAREVLADAWTVIEGLRPMVREWTNGTSKAADLAAALPVPHAVPSQRAEER